MKIIKPSVEIITPLDGESILKHLELCGRVCYKSEGKITDDSAKPFIAGIIKRGHEAVLEHASFIFELNHTTAIILRDQISAIREEGFVCCLRLTDDGRPVVSGNVRAWRDFFKACLEVYNGLPHYAVAFVNEHPVLFPEFQNERATLIRADHAMTPLSVADLRTKTEKMVHHDITVRFICDRGVSHEIVRHRLASYCQESTRYCNYDKDDFGREITVIAPCYLERGSFGWAYWLNACTKAESEYFDLLNWGCTPQEARAVLPNSLKTEVVMTANIREWRHFLKLRTAPAAHPQMRELTVPLLRELKEKVPVLFDDIMEG